MPLTEKQKKLIDERIRREGLNEFGDPKGTVYAGGTPLFDMRTGRMLDRYEYILSRHRDWLPQLEKEEQDE
ncbi:hypothetical protein CWRG_01695 [Chthonomonas calidirosea]|uniref:Uncharacterized protein n=1 Tax=Chthonomonas calidirosea (strain DSM 23976 / ICMP 18418 / T49) TaxID=1303518 RepID=S0EXH9_CHTCT|nr:hypothetical protein [Chthonomonas calidirosea]CCW36188.1 hypothetical protein CCALI_02384 [Chthonomonas calidirosea T49]CEK17020.1 hypothetical protein CWRG_01695 [Chthonomonas calidirosea]CEK17021.1 hypothetical protein CP488_01709 [Chthonomonas calidirosea]CEK18079.1 hypothetical protein CTKA_01712 [Chthonomonas calidirosea]